MLITHPMHEDPTWGGFGNGPRVGAIISPCGRYRYTLERKIEQHRFAVDHFGCKPLVWLMLNPSTADATTDDPTVRKVRGFTERAGYPGFVVVNLYAWRERDADMLGRCVRKDAMCQDALGPVVPMDYVGPRNEAIVRIVCAGATVVCAWGRPSWAREQALRVLGWVVEEGANLVCLDTNRDGSPCHPLMQPYSKRLRPFRTDVMEVP